MRCGNRTYVRGNEVKDSTDETLRRDKPPVTNSLETEAAALASAEMRGASIVRPGPAMVMRCLLVSESHRHLQHIAATAAEQGWQSVSHSEAALAFREAVRTRFHLAFVDTQSVADRPTEGDYEQLAIDLGRGNVPLIVISGDTQDPLGEIRARKLGVWLYLPGFDEASGLDVVFHEARVATEKLAQPPPASPRPAVSTESRSSTWMSTSLKPPSGGWHWKRGTA